MAPNSSARRSDDLLLLTDSFRAWLTAHRYTSSTVRNYLVDVNKFLSSPAVSALSQPVTLTQLLSAGTLLTHLSQISAQNNYRRQLASLNRFCQFALDQRLVTKNNLKTALKKLSAAPSSASPDLEFLLSGFQNHLVKHHKTPLTIKNYINDLRQFINWTDSDTP